MLNHCLLRQVRLQDAHRRICDGALESLNAICAETFGDEASEEVRDMVECYGHFPANVECQAFGSFMQGTQVRLSGETLGIFFDPFCLKLR